MSADRSLLDVGCGDGHFLAAAREAGWKVYGSEYGEGPRARARDRGLDVRPAPFAATSEELGTFDVVTAIEVLEHVAEPRVELEQIVTLLRPGGCLYLTTPNFDALTRRLLGPRWRVIEYPEHLNLFTPPILERLLARMGVEKQWLRTTGISPSDIWAGVQRGNHRSAKPVGAENVDDRLRTGVATSRTLNRATRAANVVLSSLGLGDTIKVMYTKNPGASS